MNLSEYDTRARSTALPTALNNSYLVPGIAGEYGEIKELKIFKPKEMDKLIGPELGDHLWFVALLASIHGFSIEDIVLTEEAVSNLDDYQDLIQESLEVERPSRDHLIDELGLYVGDLNTIYAKAVRDDEGVFTIERLSAFRLALANIVFSVARLAAFYNLTVEELMDKNIAKLLDRKSRGKLGGSGDNR